MTRLMIRSRHEETNLHKKTLLLKQEIYMSLELTKIILLLLVFFLINQRSLATLNCIAPSASIF